MARPVVHLAGRAGRAGQIGSGRERTQARVQQRLRQVTRFVVSTLGSDAYWDAKRRGFGDDDPRQQSFTDFWQTVQQAFGGEQRQLEAEIQASIRAHGDVRAALREALDSLHEFQTNWEQIFEDNLRAVGEAAGQRLLDNLASQGVLTDGVQYDPERASSLLSQALMAGQAADAARAIIETTRDALSDKLSTAIDTGGVDSVINTLQDTYQTWIDGGRAGMIADTAVVGGWSLGEMDAAFQAANVTGASVSRTWVTMGDDRVRTSHADADGQQVSLNETFRVGDEDLEYPGDPSASLSETAGCRCWVEYSFDLSQGGGAGDLTPDELSALDDAGLSLDDFMNASDVASASDEAEAEPSEWEVQRQSAIDQALGSGASGAASSSAAFSELLMPVSEDTTDATVETVADMRARVLSELTTRLQGNGDFTALAESGSLGATPEDTVAAVLRAWDTGSGATYGALQQAVREEFGLSDAAWSTRAMTSEARALYTQAGDGIRAVARAMYENTQDFLRANDITEVTVYRGVSYASEPGGLDAALFQGEQDASRLALQPATSWTVSPDTAAYWANNAFLQGSEAGPYRLLMSETVPADQVLSVAQTGMGYSPLGEAIMLGGDRKVAIEAATATGEELAPAAQPLTDWEAQHVAELSRAYGVEPPPDLFGRGASASTSDWEQWYQQNIKPLLPEGYVDPVFGAVGDTASAADTAFSAAQAESEYHYTLSATYDLTEADQAFAAQLKEQIAALDQSALTPDEMISIGEQLNGRIESDLVDYKAWSDEAAAMFAKGPENYTPDELLWAKRDPDAIAAHGGVKFLDAQAQYQAEYQARVSAYLSEIREMGGDINIAARGGSQVADRVFDAIESVQTRIPSDWIDASNALGKLTINEVAQRAQYGGYYSPFANGNGRIAIDTIMVRQASLESTFLHEMMHRLENAIPQLSELEAAFYDMRTSGEDAVPLTNGIDQLTKLDQWVDQYLGREPIDYSPWGVDARTYELLSVGAEAAMGGGATYNLVALRTDEQFMAFILGLLAAVEAG